MHKSKRWSLGFVPRNILFLSVATTIILAFLLMWYFQQKKIDSLKQNIDSVTVALNKSKRIELKDQIALLALDKERIVLEKDLYATLIQGIGGLAVFLSLGVAWRNLKLSEESASKSQQNAQKTFEISEEGQITERFTRAVDQLGSEKLQIRLGGIYALERIAEDSKKDYSLQIMEILAAFVRAELPLNKQQEEDKNDMIIDYDIQAILTVIGRRKRVDELTEFSIDLPGAIDLNRTYLRGVKLHKTKLHRVKLYEANLKDANFNGAIMENVNCFQTNFQKADFTNANLKGAHLEKADLSGAKLEGADLSGAKLEDANLNGANLKNAQLKELFIKNANPQIKKPNLKGADLTNAILEGSDLSGVIGLTQAQLAQAVIDENTQLPDYLLSLKQVQ